MSGISAESARKFPTPGSGTQISGAKLLVCLPRSYTTVGAQGVLTSLKSAHPLWISAVPPAAPPENGWSHTCVVTTTPTTKKLAGTFPAPRASYLSDDRCEGHAYFNQTPRVHVRRRSRSSRPDNSRARATRVPVPGCCRAGPEEEETGGQVQQAHAHGGIGDTNLDPQRHNNFRRTAGLLARSAE